jgi:hypothetical protein
MLQYIPLWREPLKICVDWLYPGGALQYLPQRFLLWFTYAAVLLLKGMKERRYVQTTEVCTISSTDSVSPMWTKVRTTTIRLSVSATNGRLSATD